MKNNVKLFARLLPVLLIVAIGATGCNRKPRWGTVLGARPAGVPEDGMAGGKNGRPGGGPNLDGTPIRPGPGFDPNAGAVTSTPVDPGQIGTEGSHSRTEFDNTDPDASKFAAQTVYFDFDKYNIKPGEVEKIRTVATHMKANASHLLEVDGHCDERGTEEYNRALGERRAQAIREFLAREGVAADRVRTISFGEDKPADPSHNESAWSKNRRGEFILLLPRKTL